MRKERELLAHILNLMRNDELENNEELFWEIKECLAEPEKKREPLSEEEINAKMKEYTFLLKSIEFQFGFRHGVYFAEKHHGIGGEDENTTST